MKKILSLFLMMMLIFALFAGCQTEPDSESVDEGTETEGEAEPEPAAKTVVKFAVQADPTGALDEIAKAFNESSELYTVEPVIMTNDSGAMHDQLINSLSSMSGEYDLISMDVVWAGEFAAAGYLQPVDQLIMEMDWMPTDFNAGSMASGKYKGKNYVLPYFSDLGFLYYRADIVSEEDAAMLESGEYTFADLLSLSEMYKGEEGTLYGHVFQAKQYEGLTCNINEFTSNWTDISGGLEMMKKFVDSDATPNDILTYTEGETHNAFLNGESVFARNWPYMNGMAGSGEYNISIDQVGYAPLPGGGTVGGWILGINSNTQNMDGAKAFLSFISGPEGQKINATVGSYMPGFNDLLTDSDVLAANALLTNAGFANALSTTIARPVVANYSEVSDVIQITTHEYLSGNGDLDEATDTLTMQLEQ